MRRAAIPPALAGLLLLAAPGPPLHGQTDSPPPPVRGTTPAAPVTPVAMTPAQIETVLRARGYDRLEGLEREGPEHFRLASAERFGARVGPLRLDAATGQVLEEPPLTEEQVRALLRARGYAEVPEIQRRGDAVFARARREGTEVALRIDPRSGVVRPWQD
jgi:hypothetical protein